MKLKAYNKRLKHTTVVKSVDETTSRVKLVMPESDPIFVYEESLGNIELLEFTGVILNDEEIYVGDEVTDGKGKVRVAKVPGGFFPFVKPVNVNFKKVNE